MTTPDVVASVAAAAGGDGLDLNVFAQYGVLGVITLLLIVFARGAYQREKDRADQAAAENRQLYSLMLDRVIPAVTSATSAVETSTELLAAMQREREIDRVTRARRDDPS
jgi:hypothetical protein